MEKQKSNKGVIVLLTIIIIILLALCVLFATDTIVLNTNNKDDATDQVESQPEEIIDTVDTKEEAAKKLKEKLTDEEWVKNNLYSKKNCFGESVSSANHELTFAVLTDSNDNPMVVVLDKADANFIMTAYRVYFDNGDIKVDNVGGVNHPSHVNYSIDAGQGLVITEYAHMGNYIFTAYNVKNKEITNFDKYECKTSNCEYKYEGNNIYKLSDITLKLNAENINDNIK